MSKNLDPLTIDLSDTQRWLAVDRVAVIARASERTVGRWIAAGMGATVKTPAGRVFVDRMSLFETRQKAEQAR